MDIEHDDDEEDDDDYEYSDEEESSDEDEDEKKWENFFRLIILKMHAQYDEIKKGQNNHNMVFEITISHSWQFLSSFSKLGSYLYDLHI